MWCFVIHLAEMDFLSARADLPSGTFTSGCGHHMHAECWRRYMDLQIYAYYVYYKNDRSLTFFVSLLYLSLSLSPFLSLSLINTEAF